ncbi:hypothetical protein M4914_14210 [Streptomyces somaliensis DSM 40738]|uniref:Uncharacterized protein n=1 Tax=Streptomyces somaliensis (strain ATCC 33201 / DSM 40738 / JCM 12659 / KCTC 9044 / NCTC 11332 / NRRL B-12077 / IP 733) TaxID=1134445 RepID=A0AA44IF85_STRE0|nr:hypothetical protein [Streptomyces somaliensis]MCQ0023992.1 hypothetical protein [Streptomyces somaliensis DSM 40738]NKY16372.1 hypothetical protein [Streptomyces somaliensis DSM 40738]
MTRNDDQHPVRRPDPGPGSGADPAHGAGPVRRVDQRSGHEAEAAEAARRAEEERAASRPFDYPHPERRPGVRATRRVTREAADADSVPGVPGGYGTTGGGQPGGSPGINPDRRGTLDPSEYADTIAGGEPDPRRDPRED